MKLVIVPNHVSDAIHAALDKAAEGLILTKDEREQHYNTLLNYFDENGVIPNFKLAMTPIQKPMEGGSV